MRVSIEKVCPATMEDHNIDLWQTILLLAVRYAPAFCRLNDVMPLPSGSLPHALTCCIISVNDIEPVLLQA